MKAIDDFGEHLQIVLRKMCNMVGADADKIDFKSNNWFWQYEWTKDQEQEFVKWLTDYLYQNTKARKEIMEYPIKRKAHCRKVAEFFAWNYGWKTK